MTEIFFFSNFNTFINKFNTYLKDFCCYKQNVHGIRIDILSIATRINFIKLTLSEWSQDNHVDVMRKVTPPPPSIPLAKN